jgi:CDP-glycerol glycerophosphotransferase (TagB/SpsB family)
LVVKPHPLDADNFKIPLLRTILEEELVQAGLSLYRLLARSCALVTDYSSVWTDYIPLDRPIGLFCPDLEAYTNGRGFSLGVLDDRPLPGPLFSTAVEFRDFLVAVVTDPRVGGEARRAAVASLGIEHRNGATERLMHELRLRFNWPVVSGV